MPDVAPAPHVDDVPTCTSCGAVHEPTQPVRRVYLTPGDGLEPGRRVLDDIEHWCVPCLTNYPHEPA